MHIIEYIHIIMHIFSAVAGQVESVIEIRNIVLIFHAKDRTYSINEIKQFNYCST